MAWLVELLDGAGNVGYENSIALDLGGYLHIS